MIFNYCLVEKDKICNGTNIIVKNNSEPLLFITLLPPSNLNHHQLQLGSSYIQIVQLNLAGHPLRLDQ